MRHSQATTSRRRALGLAAAASVLTMTGCGLSGENALGPAKGRGTVVVGSADFVESQIIAEIYAAALNNAGHKAETDPAIGAREAYIGAIQQGSVSLVPDYSGNLLQYFDAKSTASTAEDIMAGLKSVVPQGLEVMEASPAEDKDALVVTQSTAKKYGLSSLTDLGSVCSNITLAGPPEFQERAYGLPGLKDKYGCVPQKFSPINDAGGPLTVKALLDDQVQVADIFTTTPAIEKNHLVVLDDPKNNFIAQQVIPLIRSDQVPEAAREVINKVSRTLTTQDLIHLNDRVSGDEKVSTVQAAQDWTSGKGM
ncbi:ABC transporter substrate-binding protein [uncultured Kocuria sp.]|uniref:ABC transporter substrate-binding protein n=1 Tax=uncultured Kocuria sp. TaxID=259305 RepID=UPI002595CD46|nr:ABC transporter substrate-binding protein [uncultured Kocuria sp.]MCT1367056.1 ABC transporter substrate-binding protein [Rothia sp. p3-SID1597]